MNRSPFTAPQLKAQIKMLIQEREQIIADIRKGLFSTLDSQKLMEILTELLLCKEALKLLNS